MSTEGDRLPPITDHGDDSRRRNRGRRSNREEEARDQDEIMDICDADDGVSLMREEVDRNRPTGGWSGGARRRGGHDDEGDHGSSSSDSTDEGDAPDFGGFDIGHFVEGDDDGSDAERPRRPTSKRVRHTAAETPSTAKGGSVKKGGGGGSRNPPPPPPVRNAKRKPADERYSDDDEDSPIEDDQGHASKRTPPRKRHKADDEEDEDGEDIEIDGEVVVRNVDNTKRQKKKSTTTTPRPSSSRGGGGGGGGGGRTISWINDDADPRAKEAHRVKMTRKKVAKIPCTRGGTTKYWEFTTGDFCTFPDPDAVPGVMADGFITDMYKDETAHGDKVRISVIVRTADVKGVEDGASRRVEGFPTAWRTNRTVVMKYAGEIKGMRPLTVNKDDAPPKETAKYWLESNRYARVVMTDLTDAEVEKEKELHNNSATALDSEIFLSPNKRRRPRRIEYERVDHREIGQQTGDINKYLADNYFTTFPPEALFKFEEGYVEGRATRASSATRRGGNSKSKSKKKKKQPSKTVDGETNVSTRGDGGEEKVGGDTGTVNDDGGSGRRDKHRHHKKKRDGDDGESDKKKRHRRKEGDSGHTDRKKGKKKAGDNKRGNAGSKKRGGRGNAGEEEKAIPANRTEYRYSWDTETFLQKYASVRGHHNPDDFANLKEAIVEEVMPLAEITRRRLTAMLDPVGAGPIPLEDLAAMRRVVTQVRESTKKAYGECMQMAKENTAYEFAGIISWLALYETTCGECPFFSPEEGLEVKKPAGEEGVQPQQTVVPTATTTTAPDDDKFDYSDVLSVQEVVLPGPDMAPKGVDDDAFSTTTTATTTAEEQTNVSIPTQ